MRVELACGPAKLGGIHGILDRVKLPLQPFHVHLNLLAQSHRRGRLAVGSGKHWHVFPRLGSACQRLDEFLHGWQQHVLGGTLQGQRNGRVVDVLRGQAKVHKFLPRPQPHAFHAVFDEVLHCLDVVVGPGFGGFDPFRVFNRKAFHHAAHGRWPRRREILELGQPQIDQGQKILHLHLHPMANEAVFRQPRRERFGVATVTSVNG